mmetsp:Transcript_63998/g.150585  ORF Transcript_63998/g.150585 Transcript_63998/m.150585 type:complete len:275 (+) Transcript_63998:239-1063(+)
MPPAHPPSGGDPKVGECEGPMAVIGPVESLAASLCPRYSSCVPNSADMWMSGALSDLFTLPSGSLSARPGPTSLSVRPGRTPPSPPEGGVELIRPPPGLSSSPREKLPSCPLPNPPHSSKTFFNLGCVEVSGGSTSAGWEVGPVSGMTGSDLATDFGTVCGDDDAGKRHVAFSPASASISSVKLVAWAPHNGGACSGDSGPSSTGEVGDSVSRSTSNASPSMHALDFTRVIPFPPPASAAPADPPSVSYSGSCMTPTPCLLPLSQPPEYTFPEG